MNFRYQMHLGAMGLDVKLMDLLGSIGESWRMQKIMLTVFEGTGVYTLRVSN